MKTSLVILAAGMGSRYGGLKQIDPVGPSGEIVIEYSIFDALRAGFEKIVFIIRRDIEEEFRAAIGKKFEGRADVRYVFQDLADLPPGFAPSAGRTKPWGTGHALLTAQPEVDEPFAILNADDFYGAGGFRSLREFLLARDPAAAEYALVGFLLRNTLSPHGSVSRGICDVDDAYLLRGVTELTKIAADGAGAANENPDGTRIALTGDEYVSMNLWGFTPAVFPQIREAFVGFLQRHGGEEKSEFYIPTATDVLIRSGSATVQVLPSSDAWFGVTYPEDKPQVMRSVRALVDAGDYPSPLFG